MFSKTQKRKASRSKISTFHLAHAEHIVLQRNEEGISACVLQMLFQRKGGDGLYLWQWYYPLPRCEMWFWQKNAGCSLHSYIRGHENDHLFWGSVLFPVMLLCIKITCSNAITSYFQMGRSFIIGVCVKQYAKLSKHQTWVDCKSLFHKWAWQSCNV